MPRRALGVQWLGLDQAPRTLNVAPRRAGEGQVRRPRSTVPVKIARPDGRRGGAHHASPPSTSASSTSRASRRPTPEDWFFGQRRLGTEIRDFYGRLIDGMRAERGTLRSGGDGRPAAWPCRAARRSRRRSRCSPASSKSVPTARRKVEFQLPDFNGTVRVMAVAWSADKVGSRHQGRDRARSGGAHRVGPALPDARRRGAPRARRCTTSKARRAPTPSPASTSWRRAPSRSRGFERTVALNAGERKREAFELELGRGRADHACRARHRPQRHRRASATSPST